MPTNAELVTRAETAAQTATDKAAQVAADKVTVQGYYSQITGMLNNTITLPNPTITVNVSTGVITAEYTPSVGTNASAATKSGTLTISSVSGTNLTAGNIKSGVTILGVTGNYEGAGGTDTSGATVTADDVLSGVTAYGASGLITGNIATVTATQSGNVVTVPKGYIASAQTITVGTAKAAATYTPGTTDQTIASGQYLTGAQTISGDSNLIAGNIKNGVSIFGVTGNYEGSVSSDFDFSPASDITAGDLLQGVSAYGSAGTLVTGNIATVTATLSGNVVTVPTGYIASSQTITVGTAKAAQTYTPTTSDQTIASGQYLTGVQTIKGDANLIAGNIKSGVSIFGVAGSYVGSGGGGSSTSGVSIIKVTQNSPATEASNLITSFVISGLQNTYDPEAYTGYDFTPYNGTWKCCNPDETDYEKRIYSNGNAYFSKFLPNEDEGMYGDPAWVVSSSARDNTDYYMGSIFYATAPNKDLDDNSLTWYVSDMISMDAGISTVTPTITATRTAVQASASSSVGVIAEDYDLTNNTWVFSSSPTNITDSVYPLVENGLFACKNGVVFSRMMDYSGTPTRNLVFHHPLTSILSTAPTGQALTTSGSPSIETQDGRVCTYFDGSSNIVSANLGIVGGGPITLAAWMKLSGNNWTGPTYGVNTRAKAMCIGHVDGHVSYNLLSISDDGYGAASYNTWHHVIFCVDAVNNIRKAYVDGVQRISDTASAPSYFILPDSGIQIAGLTDGNKTTGYIADMRVYNTVLSDDEAKALYTNTLV